MTAGVALHSSRSAGRQARLVIDPVIVTAVFCLLLIGLVALALVPPLAIATGGVVLERHEARATAASLAWTIDQQRLGADRQAIESLLK